MPPKRIVATESPRAVAARRVAAVQESLPSVKSVAALRDAVAELSEIVSRLLAES